MAGTRIRPDKQIQTAPGQGYVLHSDINGELQFALLSAIAGNGTNADFAIGDIHTIDSIQLLGSTLVMRYTTSQGQQMVKSCDLTSLAVDVKVTGAFLQHPEGNTYILQITQSDGSTTSVNLSELLTIVTRNSADIILTGNGTPTNPLTAVLTESAKAAMGGAHWTDEFTGLSTGNTVQLSYTPMYPFPVHVYRNGLRQKELTEWRQDIEYPKRLFLLGAPFGANGQYETVIVDYKTIEPVGPRHLTD